jgi:hypothetical protein
MSLNLCKVCNLAKKNCECVVETFKKISWWRRIFFWNR